MRPLAWLLLLFAPLATAWDCDDESGLYHCQDFDSYASYSDRLWLQRNILTPIHRSSGGWDNGPFLRMRVNDYGAESGAGYVPPTPPGNSYNTPQLNVGFMIRFGSDFEAKLDVEEYKATMVLNHYFSTQGSGTMSVRPIIMDKHYRQDGNLLYRTWAPCNEAGGGCLFPPPNPPPFEWRDSSPQGNSPFQIRNHIGEWLYMEYELIANGTVKLWIVTRDSQFNEPYTTIDATSRMGNLGRVHVIMGYWEGASNTTANTYYDIDFVRTDNAFMGPPPGFRDGEEPQPSLVPPQNLQLRVN